MLFVAVVAGCILASVYSRVLLIAFLSIACSYELCKNLRTIGIKPRPEILYAYTVIQALFAVFTPDYRYSIFIFALAVISAMTVGTVFDKVSGKDAFSTVGALAYPCFLFSAMMLIGVSDVWLECFALGIGSMWVCDVFALIGGTLFGKHLLAPAVSPNKTVEGAVCGLISGTLCGLPVYYLLRSSCPLSLPLCLFAAFAASVFGQLGDLSESLLKRLIGIKDFSEFIPGHGGVFDRCDSLLFAVPGAYLSLFIAGYIK